jgi:hypothetical protein
MSEAPTIEERAAAIVDGVYFDLPAEVYHAVARLSASGIQKLLVSAGTFWRGSWLDPNRPEPDEDMTKAQTLGRAYHTARLEPEKFAGLYVRALEKAEAPKGTLFTGEAMAAELKALGVKSSGSVDEQADRLLAAYAEADDPDAYKPIWRLMLREWEGERGDRTPLPGKYFDDIASDMERIHSMRDVAQLLEGGAAEVSVFWTDENGVQLKARLDYLQATTWADLKTFDNTRGKELEQAIADAFQFNRSHVQAALYKDAVDAIRSGKVVVIEGSAAQRELIDALILAQSDPQCWYIYVEKNGVPNVLAKEVQFHEVPVSTRLNDAGASAEGIKRMHDLTRQPAAFYTKARREIKKAKRRFKAYSDVYQPGEEWRPFKPLGSFTDASFRPNWIDEDIGE